MTALRTIITQAVQDHGHAALANAVRRWRDANPKHAPRAVMEAGVLYPLWGSYRADVIR